MDTGAIEPCSGTRGTPHGMLAPWVRVEGCTRCAHGTTGKRTSHPQFVENPKEKLPASSIVLFRASGFEARPRFPRPPPFPLSSVSSQNFVSAGALFCASSAMFLQNASNCCQHVSKRTSPGLDDLHDPLRPALATSSMRASISSAPSAWAL